MVSHYQIIRECGRGGTGVVFEAEDLKLHRRVALKSLKHADKSSEELRARLIDEARLAARVHHPNIATIFGFEDAPAGGVVVAMEFVEGTSLRAIIQRGPTEVSTAISIIEQVLDALSAAHELGVIHRDLKPENIMITRNGRVKLLDFGLAKPVGASVEGKAEFDTESSSYRDLEGHLVGTPGYIPPELVEGREADVRSDIFSFGIVVYELLTGRLCFEGRNPLERLMAVIAERPAPRLRDVLPDAPRALDLLVLKCLDKAPERRFSDVEKVRDTLELVKDELRARDQPQRPSALARPLAEPTSDLRLSTGSLSLKLAAPSLPIPAQRRVEIVTNPGSNIPRPYLSYYGIHYTPQRIVVDGEYHDITGASTSFEEIDRWVTTSARFPQMIGTLAHEYARAFQKLQSAGGEIINIQSSKKIIRSYFAAMSATKTISSHHGKSTPVPYIVDGGGTDLFTGLLTLLAAQARESGMNARAISRLVEEASGRGAIVISPDNLDYLLPSGRSPWGRRNDLDLEKVRPLYHFVRGEQVALPPLPRRRGVAKGIVSLTQREVPAGTRVWAGVMHGGGGAEEEAEAIATGLRAAYDVELMLVRPFAASTYLQIGPGAIGACVIAVDKLSAKVAAPAPLPDTEAGPV